MRKRTVYCVLLWISFVNILIVKAIQNVDVENKRCDNCLLLENCSYYGNMRKEQQQKWILDHSCPMENDGRQKPLREFSAVAVGDYVCCPNINSRPSEGEMVFKDNPYFYNNINKEMKLDTRNQHEIKTSTNRDFKSNTKSSVEQVDNIPSKNYEKSLDSKRWPSPNSRLQRPYIQKPRVYQKQIQDDRNNNPYFMRNINVGRVVDNPYFLGVNDVWRGNDNGRRNNDTDGIDLSNFPNDYGRSDRDRNTQDDSNDFGRNDRDRNTQNNPNERGSNTQGITEVVGQCTRPMSYPPDIDSGCCGLEISDVDGDDDSSQSPSSQNRRWGSFPRSQEQSYPNGNNFFGMPSFFNLFSKRDVRDTDSTVNVTLDSRIAGGKVTRLSQYPWTVLLKTTFNYGDKEATFSCGGSIISSRYVLTAAHCVSEENARTTDVEVTLAEYDKTTSPTDCINVPGEGKKCITNVIIHAENVVVHPEFDDQKLQNDIALLRLRMNAPYNEFIRPICLPPFDLDNPNFSDLRLEVTGWGRNGRFNTNVKQSTVIYLVPQRECSRSYPSLTRRHLCAAGYRGEDTCKGDSGGPLMVVNQGKYFVVGIVSGKRSDTPCGSSIPSLYTNVYHYLEWITNNLIE